MEFGTNKVFEYIKYNLVSSVDEEWYNRIYAVIKADTLMILSSYKLSRDDKEDIIQVVQIAAVNGLAKYIRDSSDYSETQRNAWLKQIVKRKIADFFRRKYRKLEDSAEDVISNEKMYMRFFSKDEIEEKYRNEEIETKLIHAIKCICEINTSAEKIIAFLLNKVIGSLEMSRMNGSPKGVVDTLSGKTVLEASKYMKEQLQYMISINIPPQVYEGLDKKVDLVMKNEDYSKRMFTITPRIITDSSNWITSKLKEGEKNETY